MRLVFCGTPQFAVPCLDALVRAGHDVRLVVSQPDRPSGRGLATAPTPVKKLALEHGLAVTQPERIKNNDAFRSELEAIRPDAIVVVAYGRIIPAWMLELPRHGNINVHASLLPKYRGAAPIQWSVANGDAVTGVTTMRLDAGLDTGDMLLKAEVPIQEDDTSVTLAPRLSAAGAEVLLQTLGRLEDGSIAPVPQRHCEATLAPILKKEDGRVSFQRTARDIFNRLRGFQPWPGAFTSFRGKLLTLHSVCAANHSAAIPSGEIFTTGERMMVGCADTTALEIFELQLEGKKRMSARDFLNGYRPQPGERLGD